MCARRVLRKEDASIWVLGHDGCDGSRLSSQACREFTRREQSTSSRQRRPAGTRGGNSNTQAEAVGVRVAGWRLNRRQKRGETMQAGVVTLLSSGKKQLWVCRVDVVGRRTGRVRIGRRWRVEQINYTLACLWFALIHVHGGAGIKLWIMPSAAWTRRKSMVDGLAGKGGRGACACRRTAGRRWSRLIMMDGLTLSLGSSAVLGFYSFDGRYSPSPGPAETPPCLCQYVSAWYVIMILAHLRRHW